VTGGGAAVEVVAAGCDVVVEMEVVVEADMGVVDVELQAGMMTSSATAPAAIPPATRG